MIIRRIFIVIAIILLIVLAFNKCETDSNKLYYVDIIISPTNIEQRVKKYNINDTKDKYRLRVIKKVMFSEAIYLDKEISSTDFVKYEKYDYSEFEIMTVSQFIEEYFQIDNPERLYYNSKEMEDPKYKEK